MLHFKENTKNKKNDSDPDYIINDPFAMLPGKAKIAIEEYLANICKLYKQDASNIYGNLRKGKAGLANDTKMLDAWTEEA